MATVVDASGKEVETRKLADARFAVPADVNTLHLVVRAEQAARRSGTASTKTRGEVSGSTAKLYRQKGTGRARAGSVKSPIRTGGGVTFGPHPRSFDIKINKKVIRKALSMALSERAAHGRVFVAAGLELAEPSTRTVEQFLVNLDCAAPVLVVTHDEPVVHEVGPQPPVRRGDGGGCSVHRAGAARPLAGPHREGVRRPERGVTMVEAEKIIIRPIISEKSYAQIDHSRYTFEVHPDAHKTMIAQAVHQLFNVTVVGVSTANVRPKPKRRGMTKGRTSAWKKAVVQLAPGDKIEFFEGR